MSLYPHVALCEEMLLSLEVFDRIGHTRVAAVFPSGALGPVPRLPLPFLFGRAANTLLSSALRLYTYV